MAITALLSQTVIATDVYCDVTHAHTPNTDVVIGFDQTLYTAYENDGVTYVTASVQQGTLRQSVYALHLYQTLQNGLVTSTFKIFVFLQLHSGYIGKIALWLREEKETAGVLLANSNTI